MNTSYGRERVFFYIVFGALLFMKSLLPSRDGDDSFLNALVPAVLYAAMFGSPQLFWLFKTRALKSRSQSVVAAFTAAFFLGSYYYFGFLPGQRSQDWGSSYFEVPAAFVVEWVITGFMFAFYARAGLPDMSD